MCNYRTYSMLSTSGSALSESDVDIECVISAKMYYGQLTIIWSLPLRLINPLSRNSLIQLGVILNVVHIFCLFLLITRFSSEASARLRELFSFTKLLIFKFSFEVSIADFRFPYIAIQYDLDMNHSQQRELVQNVMLLS